jgi:4-amino-4-deoxy-L-arabinose transferase-like glycosyltransferase
MNHRNFRIVLSVAWGVVAVLLVVMWDRSNTWGEGIRYVGHGLEILFGYTKGDVFLSFYDEPSDSEERGAVFFHFPIHNPERKFFFSNYGFHRDGENNHVPFWFPVLVSVILVALPWLPGSRWRFSLRTLLIVTTLVAVGLGFVVYLFR